MKTYRWLILLIFSMFSEYGQAVTLYKPYNMVSQTVILFQSNISLLVSSDFTISLNANFTSNPLISHGLNHYRMSDRMYYENIKTFITSTNSISFSLSVFVIQSTNLFKCSITYLASQDKGYILMWNKDYLNPSKVSKGKGNRSIKLVQAYNFTTFDVSGTLFITGFYLQSVKEYYVNVNLLSITDKNYTVQLSTQSDCIISRVHVSFIFYFNKEIIADYSISIRHFACFYNINYQNTTAAFADEGRSIFMFGIMGFSGLTINSILDLGWEKTSNTVNMSIITINTNNLDYLCYNFIQISSLRPRPPPNSTLISNEIADGGDNKQIIIIAVSISIITVVIVIIILLVRRWWKKKYFQVQKMRQSKKNLSLANLNELPSIQF